MRVLQVIILALVSLLPAYADQMFYNIFCYWDMMSSARRLHTNFRSLDIESKYCTHLIYGSLVYIGTNGLVELNVHNPHSYPDIKGLRSYVSVGDPKNDSTFPAMMADIEQRDKVYMSLLQLLFKWEFQGVQINWKLPDDIQPADRENFVTFLHELKIILAEHHFELMVAVSARLDSATLAAYDIPKIAKYVDLISLIPFDQSTLSGESLSYNAPLHGDASNSISRAVEHWAKHSKMPSKLVLGVPTFARSFTMKSGQAEVGASCKGPGRSMRGSIQPGYMTYGELCVQVGKWHKGFDEVAQVPYAHLNDQWVTYEDWRSIGAKMRFVKEKQLSGALIWSVDADDFRGECGEPYSLTRIIVSLIGDRNSLTTPEPYSEGHGICPKDGWFRHVWECNYYYQCLDGKRTDYECPKGFFFEPKLERCLPEKEVNCPQDFVTWRPGQPGYNHDNLPLNLKVVE